MCLDIFCVVCMRQLEPIMQILIFEFSLWDLLTLGKPQRVKNGFIKYPLPSLNSFVISAWPERMRLSGDKCKNKWLSLSLSIRTEGAEINTPEMVVEPRVPMTGHQPDRVIQTCNVWHNWQARVKIPSHNWLWIKSKLFFFKPQLHRNVLIVIILFYNHEYLRLVHINCKSSPTHTNIECMTLPDSYKHRILSDLSELGKKRVFGFVLLLVEFWKH